MVPKVLLDANVVLDLLLARQSFCDDALAIFAMGEARAADLLLSVDAVSTIAYVLTRNKGADVARSALANLIGRVRLATLDGDTVVRGLSLGFVDIEDSLVAAVAESVGADAIVTRNVKDFGASPVRVLLPGEFLACYASRS